MENERQKPATGYACAITFFPGKTGIVIIWLCLS